MKNNRPKTGPDWLDERIGRGETILIDGATGTELEHRGVPMHDSAWCAAAIHSHPDTLQSVHQDYIAAGAKVIIANTYCASRQVIEPAGLGGDVVGLNQRAVEIAMRARDAAAEEEVAIAGSISDYRVDDDPRWGEPSTLRATYREQAEALAAAGADLLVMEMMQEPEYAIPATQAALATGLPVWVGMSCRSVPGRRGLVMFDFPQRAFSETLDAVVGLGAGVMTVMHSEVTDIAAGLAALRERWDGPMGAYPNSGYFRPPNWQFVDIISPEDFAAAAIQWVHDGAQIVGGCCGICPAHISRLRAELATIDRGA